MTAEEIEAAGAHGGQRSGRGRGPEHASPQRPADPAGVDAAAIAPGHQQREHERSRQHGARNQGAIDQEQKRRGDQRQAEAHRGLHCRCDGDDDRGHRDFGGCQRKQSLPFERLARERLP